MALTVVTYTLAVIKNTRKEASECVYSTSLKSGLPDNSDSI